MSIATLDDCNSLHTNAYDEAVTTPSTHSMRRALAIQMIIDKEWGLAGNENPLQGSFVLDQLADLVEEAVLAEFDRISERGGILDAMETGYQRGKIQDESMLYEHRKHDGSLPLVGVNTFTDPARTAPRPRRLSWPGLARPKAGLPGRAAVRRMGTRSQRGGGYPALRSLPGPYDRDLSGLVAGAVDPQRGVPHPGGPRMTSAFHDTGIERFHHPIVGARPSFDDETVRRRLTMAVYVAEPGSPSHGALNLLVGWEVTLEQAEAANAVARL